MTNVRQIRMGVFDEDAFDVFQVPGAAGDHLVNDEMIEQRVLVKTVTATDVTLQEPRSRVERTVPLVEGK